MKNMLTKDIKRGKSGFTLAELQIAALISAILLIAVISLYVYCQASFYQGDKILDVYSNSRIAMSWMSRDIKAGAQIIAVSAIGAGDYATSNTCLVLRVPSVTGAVGNFSVIPAQFDEVIYTVEAGGNLRRVVRPSAGSARTAQNQEVAKYCEPVAFSSVTIAGSVSTWTPLDNVDNLNTVNNLGISLPVNEVMHSLSVAEVTNAEMTPTSVIRMRNT